MIDEETIHGVPRERAYNIAVGLISKGQILFIDGGGVMERIAAEAVRQGCPGRRPEVHELDSWDADSDGDIVETKVPYAKIALKSDRGEVIIYAQRYPEETK